MEKVNITVVKLGVTKYPLAGGVLTAWQSEIFNVGKFKAPEFQLKQEIYTDALLRHEVPADKDADLTLIVIDAPLEHGFYMRPLDGNRAVLSLFQTSEIIRNDGYTLEEFVIRTLYELSLVWRAYKGLPAVADYPGHYDEHKCIFNFNNVLGDIVLSMHQPTLCSHCDKDFQKRGVGETDLLRFKRELLRLQRPLYFRMADWVKKHPIRTLLIGTAGSIFLNLVASWIFELIKRL